MGPLQPCLKSTFIFSGAANPSWEANTKRFNENVGNISLTIATDLGK
jgi:hypothetical protein